MKPLSLSIILALFTSASYAQEETPRFRLNAGPMLNTTSTTLTITPSESDPYITEPFNLNSFEAGAGFSLEGSMAITKKLWLNTGFNINVGISNGENTNDKLNTFSSIPLVFSYELNNSKSAPFIGLGVAYSLREENSFFIEGDGVYHSQNGSRSFTVQCPDRTYAVKNQNLDLAFRLGKFMQTGLGNVYRLELMVNYSLDDLYTPRIGQFQETGTGSLYTIGLKISSTNYYYKFPKNRLPNKK